MGVGSNMVFVVKTNTKVLCKEIIDNTTKDCLGGSYLMLKIKYVVPRYRPIISIGCKYNLWKSIYLIAT